MAKEEKAVDYAPQEFEINDEESLEMTELEKPVTKAPATRTAKKPIKAETQLVSCLRNERVIVRHIPKRTGLVTNPKHILYGGMAENAIRVFVVPRLSSGMFVNVLTDSEKAFLEDVMGLEYNALSIYKKVDNYWYLLERSA